MQYYDDFKSPQFRSAVAIGKHADLIFRAECRKRGLDPESVMISPLAALETSPLLETVPMDREHILDLWNEGLSRPEILALGATMDEFVDAIRRARAKGDPRAYYRYGKSRLPWRIEVTAATKKRNSLHRIVSGGTERPVSSIPIQKTAKESPMTKEQPPFTPKPKRGGGDVGPSFVGQFVDDLVAVLPQIGQAKRELDKRFVPNSDILRTEVANKD